MDSKNLVVRAAKTAAALPVAGISACTHGSNPVMALDPDEAGLANIDFVV